MLKHIMIGCVLIFCSQVFAYDEVAEVPYCSALTLSNRATLAPQEREKLVQELHYCCEKAYKLILQAKKDCGRILEIDRRKTARAAVEGAITGVASTRRPIGALIGSAIATLTSLAGDRFDAIYDAISHAREAQYWGKRFDEIYAKIQRG